MQGIDAAALLTAFQLADSFFPTGMFAHSQGLEGMVRRSRIANARDLEAWGSNQLRWAVLPSDGVALLQASRAAMNGDFDQLLAIDRLLHVMKLPAELRAASQHGGRRLLAETAAMTSSNVLHEFHRIVAARQTPGNAAVALGVVATALSIPSDVALLAFGHSYSVGVLGAGLRLLRLTHSDTQAILHRLHVTIAHGMVAIAERDWQDMTALTPETDLAAIGHETDDLRMFAS